MIPPNYLEKRKIQRKFSTKKSKSLRSWQQKFHDYTGERLHWLQITLLLQGSIIATIIPWIAFFTFYGFLIALLDFHDRHIPLPKITDGFPDVIRSFNIILSLLLIFRINAANDRYWEGRKLWGALVNAVRNLVREISIVVEERSIADKLEKEKTQRLVVAFAVAMKLHLRREPVNNELTTLMSASRYSQLQNTNHPSLKIAFWIEEYLQKQYHRDLVNIYQLTNIQNLVVDLVNILGGCERILKTPTPLAYTIFLKQMLIIYCLMLPIELVSKLNWWLIPVMTLISLILFGIEELGSEIENPFGHDLNDLPLDAICNTISGNVEEIITTSVDKIDFP